MRTPLRLAALVLASLALVGLASPALALAAVPVQEWPQPDAWPGGTTEWAVLGGFAFGTVIDPQRTSTHFGEAIVRWAIHFRPMGSGWRRGNLALLVEGVPIFAIDQQPRGVGGGATLLIRYSWSAGRWRPMLLAGAGILGTNNEVPPRETNLNFTPQAGIGLQYLLHPDLAFGGEYRFHHISNNGRTETNPGINSHLILLGISWFR